MLGAAAFFYTVLVFVGLALAIGIFFKVWGGMNNLIRIRDGIRSAKTERGALLEELRALRNEVSRLRADLVARDERPAPPVPQAPAAPQPASSAQADGSAQSDDDRFFNWAGENS